MADDKYQVFIVDDDCSVRNGLSRLLRSAGYTTEVFASAEDCLEHRKLDDADCLIVDVMMPGINGPEMQKRLIERGNNVPVIFVTVDGDLPTCVQAIKRGGANFPQKPVDESILLDALKQALTHHSGD